MNELWTSDGTAVGTVLFRIGATRLGPAGDRIFFTVWGPVHGDELWITDGTVDGTKLLITEGTLGFPCGEFIRLGAKLFLTAWEPEHGNELWACGSTTGAMVPIDVVPGGGSSFPRFLTVEGDRFFFVAYSPDDGCVVGGGPPMPCFEICLGQARDLWISDGTPEGNKLIAKNIVPARTRSDQPDSWSRASSGGRLFFTGLDSEHGDEPWVSDGTPEGTRLLADLVQGTGGSSPADFVHAGDRFYFTAAGRLWVLPRSTRCPNFCAATLSMTERQT